MGNLSNFLSLWVVDVWGSMGSCENALRSTEKFKSPSALALAPSRMHCVMAGLPDTRLKA